MSALAGQVGPRVAALAALVVISAGGASAGTGASSTITLSAVVSPAPGLEASPTSKTGPPEAPTRLGLRGAQPQVLVTDRGKGIGVVGELGKQELVLVQGPDPSAGLNQLLVNIRNWLMSLLVGLATLFLTIGGVRYLLAGGDPGEVDSAKRCFKSAAVGYAVAALAPTLVEILRSLVGA